MDRNTSFPSPHIKYSGKCNRATVVKDCWKGIFNKKQLEQNENIQQKTTRYERSERQMMVNCTCPNNQHSMNDWMRKEACWAHSASPQSTVHKSTVHSPLSTVYSPQSTGHHTSQISHQFQIVFAEKLEKNNWLSTFGRRHHQKGTGPTVPATMNPL